MAYFGSTLVVNDLRINNFTILLENENTPYNGLHTTVLGIACGTMVWHGMELLFYMGKS